MNDKLILLLAVLAGVFLGTGFFAGLWWTIRLGLTSKRPALLFVGSLLLRSSLLLIGLYVVSNGHAKRLLACLLGFIIARFIVTRLADSVFERFFSPPKRVVHASEPR